jgi:ribosomal protein L40E
MTDFGVLVILALAGAFFLYWRRRASERFCPRCGTAVPPRAPVCPRCGYDFESPTRAAIGELKLP